MKGNSIGLKKDASLNSVATLNSEVNISDIDFLNLNEGKKTLFNVDKKGNITGGALEARRGSGSTDVVARFGSEIEKDENISVSQTEIIMNRKSGSGSQLKIATRMENGGKWDQNNSNSGGIVLAPDNKIAVKVDNSGKVGIGKCLLSVI